MGNLGHFARLRRARDGVPTVSMRTSNGSWRVAVTYRAATGFVKMKACDYTSSGKSKSATGTVVKF